ncbi:MAG: GNAT family N-acetyltransferase [Bacteroidales bacterium]|nr:GNAT family N-acetyltransferase [Bacteroidales bacterium]
MEKIIAPVPIKLLEQELTEDKFIRHTNYGNNMIYSVTCHDSPNIIQEIGRLREYTFRKAGGGTGKKIDIDQFDTADKPYYQLIVWDPQRKSILGGYRYILPDNMVKDKDGNVVLATSRLFKYSEKFKKDYLPFMIELGRSFVQPAYQSTQSSRKGIFALDNLWDGLGALTVDNPEVKYFFGKVTMYPDFNVEARNLILYFIEKHFGDKNNLLTLIDPLIINHNVNEYNKIFNTETYPDNYKILSQKVRALGEKIPPLVNAYMNLSPTMRSFGTSINPYFGNVEETAIMITIKDMYKSKSSRHILSYKKK